MQTQIKKLANATWINITKPEIFDVKKLLLENGISDTIAEDIVNPSHNAKVDTLRNAVYLTLHFPIQNSSKSENVEIDFLIKNNLIVTSAYNEIPYLKNYIENEVNNFSAHGGIYVNDFIYSVYNKIEREIEKTGESLKDIEADIFNVEEKRTIENIANTSKKVFDIRSKLNTHKEVLDIFATESNKIFGFEFKTHPERLLQKYKELMNNLDNQKENLTDLKDTIDFLLTNKTNQIVKTFTVVSFILLPMTFIAGFFGMNTKFPSDLVSSDYGTVYIMILMISISVLTLVYLHYKKYI